MKYNPLLAPFRASITILNPPYYHTVGRQSGDSRPTVVLATDCRSDVGDKMSADCRLTHRPTVGRLSANGQPTVGRQSVECRSIGRLSTDRGLKYTWSGVRTQSVWTVMCRGGSIVNITTCSSGSSVNLASPSSSKASLTILQRCSSGILFWGGVLPTQALTISILALAGWNTYMHRYEMNRPCTPQYISRNWHVIDSNIWHNFQKTSKMYYWKYIFA